MPDGQILSWQTDGETARLWNTTTGDFTCMPNYTTPLFCSGHASLANGSLLIAGGGYPSIGIKDTTIYCYGNCLLQFGSPWQVKSEMNYARYYPTCTTLGDGRILAIAGKDEDSEHVIIPEIYDPVLNTWITMDDADKQLPIYPFIFLLPNGKIFFAGDEIETFVLDMISGEWDEDPILAEYSAEHSSAAMYAPGKIIRIGGNTDNETLNTVELIDFNESTPMWSDASTMFNARYDHQAVLLADGTVFVIGGRAIGGSALKKTELYDPATDTWTEMDDMTYNRFHHAIALLQPDGRVLSAGGNACGNTDNFDCDFGATFASTYCTAEVFSPPYLFAGSRPLVGYAPGTVNYDSDFIVSLSISSLIVTSGIERVSFVRLGAMTHNFDQNQRYVPLNFEVRDEFTLSVEAPLNGNIAPPGYYMLFVISGAGVPSEAKFVQLQ